MTVLCTMKSLKKPAQFQTLRTVLTIVLVIFINSTVTEASVTVNHHHWTHSVASNTNTSNTEFLVGFDKLHNNCHFCFLHFFYQNTTYSETTLWYRRSSKDSAVMSIITQQFDVPFVQADSFLFNISFPDNWTVCLSLSFRLWIPQVRGQLNCLSLSLLQAVDPSGEGSTELSVWLCKVALQLLIVTL